MNLRPQNDLDNTFAVIMAGGKGERFWPISTDDKPKPFVRIIDNKSLIQLTFERINRFLPIERIFVVLGKIHLDVAKKQLNLLPEENFIVEPEGRDTAACIGFSAIHLLTRSKNGVMITLPADHYVVDVEKFNETLINGVRFAKRGDYLITIGIKPTRPETGYGYMRAFDVFDKYNNINCYKVERFVEKPDFSTALEYLKDGNYYWNAGIFIWRIQSILNGFKRYMPDMFSQLIEIQRFLEKKEANKIHELYRGFEKTSIDYGVMEKANNVLMLKGDFIWDDIGTWQALFRVMKTDENGNYRSGNVVLKDVKDSIIFSEEINIGVVGTSNLIIVASKHGVLVCDRDRAQDVREIARRFRE
ncbi:MAG: mannose-1-phosphate guanylyltransferase [Syntrophorhabdaceae bacterium]|nr:mannose-1-phosphate guanylyltransferase [Syntrophorhabdaceae bacterium]